MTRGRWHGAAGLLLALAAGALLAAGCGVRVTRIYPSTVHVPHPAGAVPAMTLEELEDLYTAGPDLDPDYKEPAAFLGTTSTMRLLAPEIQRRREELMRQSYARTDAEQRAALGAMDRMFAEVVVIEGKLISVTEDDVDIRRYRPEGIYLIDDKGNKFLPVEIELGFRLRPRGEKVVPSAPYREVDEKLGTFWRAHPTLAFPRKAIVPETRAISLYLAEPYWRVRFTWVFDPSYAAPRPARAPAEYGSGLEQLFRSP